MTTTNFEEVLKLIGLGSTIYLFLQFFIPVMQNLFAQGLTGLILVMIMFWWLTQKSK